MSDEERRGEGGGGRVGERLIEKEGDEERVPGGEIEGLSGKDI